MRNKEKRRQYDINYRKQHRVAIRIKNKLYRRLPQVTKRIRIQRRGYHHEYYLRNRDKILKRVSHWAKSNRDKRRIICKRYKEKAKRKKLDNRQKIDRIVKEFINYCKDRYAPETVRQYKINMSRFLKYIEKPGARSREYHLWHYSESRKPESVKDDSWKKDFIKIRLIEQIDKDLIINYVSYVNHEEINKLGIKLNQSEKEARLYPFKTFLLYCQRKGLIKKDLRKFIIIPPREKKHLKRVLTVDEMSRLLDMPNIDKSIGIRDRALLELSYSGLRADEILSLKIPNVNTSENSVTILNGKGDKDRVIPMTDEALYWVKRWLSRRFEFARQVDKEYLFITKSCKPIGRRAFSKMLKRYARIAKIELDISPHDLRRTTATHLVENGAPIRLIQALLGHATLKVTTKYLRLTDERIKKEHKESHPASRRNLYYGNIQR